MRHVSERTAALDAMIEAARSFYERGWMLGTSGNLSIVTQEEPLRYHVTRSGRNKGALTREDFVEVDDRAQPISAYAAKPSDEAQIHAEIYRRTSAGAVYHVHQVHASLCSTLYESEGAVPFSGLEMLKGLGLPSPHVSVEIPVVENLVNMAQLASLIGEVLDPDVPGVLIVRHGLYTWGRSPFEAFRHIEIFDYLFQYRCLLDQHQPKSGG